MSDTRKISSALISVFHKDGLEPIVKKLDELGVMIYSTGGTQKFINDLGVNVIPVEDVTDYPFWADVLKRCTQRYLVVF